MLDDPMIRVGIAGYGMVGKVRRRVVDSHPELEVVAVCDRDYTEPMAFDDGVRAWPSYEQLLDAFWDLHDPTTLNRQGPDVGSQYRSAIFFHSPEQQAAAVRSLERLSRSGRFKRPIVTTIEPAQTFYQAEEYHQHYLQKQGLGSCHI